MKVRRVVCKALSLLLHHPLPFHSREWEEKGLMSHHSPFMECRIWHTTSKVQKGFGLALNMIHMQMNLSSASKSKNLQIPMWSTAQLDKPKHPTCLLIKVAKLEASCALSNLLNAYATPFIKQSSHLVVRYLVSPWGTCSFNMILELELCTWLSWQLRSHM